MRLFLTAVLLPGVALACLHFDKNYKYKIEEGTKTAFLFHDGTEAHLVVRTDIKAPGGTLPETLAWVMPFPSLPTKYEEMEPDLFDELGRITQPKTKVWGHSKDPVRAAVDSKIKVHPVRLVGNYKIQPIEILEDRAGQEFNRWLKKNHFNSMPHDLQVPYLKKGAVFLAIKAMPKGKSATLKPLHVVYPSETLSFPLKFTHDSRTFNLDLFVFTPKSIEDQKIPGLTLVTQGNYVPAVVADQFPLLYSLLGERDGFITFYQGKNFNKPGNKLRNLMADPTITLK